VHLAKWISHGNRTVAIKLLHTDAECFDPVHVRAFRCVLVVVAARYVTQLLESNAGAK
jgi:hypothetical protein